MKRAAKTEQLKVPGDISHLSELRDFVTDIGDKYQLPGHLVRAFKLAVDEAATNIIQHAYHDKQSFITLQAEVSRNRVTMVLIDQGDYFDPNWAKEPDIRNYVEEGKRGGLGIFIMRRLIDEIEYRKTERGNELHLTKNLSAPLEGLVQEEQPSQPVSLRTRFLRWALTVFTCATVAGYVAFYFKAAKTTKAMVLETGQSLSKQIASQIGSAKPDLLLDANGKSYINAVALPVYQENVGKIYSLSVEDEDGLVAWSTLTAEINRPFGRSGGVTRVAPNAFAYRTVDGVDVYEFEHAIEYLDQPARFKKVHVLLTKHYHRSLLKNRRLGYLKVAGTILGAGYVLIVLLGTLLLHPLHNLTTWIKAQKKGDAASQIDVDAASEIGEIARAFSEMTEKFRESQQHLARQERFEKEMQVAKDIQRSLLPLTTPKIQDFEIATYYEAAQSIGGDYYDFIDVDTDTVGIAVADVAGKGVPGSLVMTMVRTALRTEARGVKDAAEVLARVNDFIIHDIKNGMFVTVLYLILDTRNHVLNFASAGHTPMILHRPQWQRTFFLNPMGFPIGIQLPDNKLMGKYLRSETIQLLPDDMLLLYTDGVTEAMNRRRELYGEERLLKVLRENSHLALSAFADKLRYSIYSFTEGSRQLDDITFLAIRDTGGAQHQESTDPSEQADSWDVGNRFLSIEDITKVLDIVVSHPEFEVDEILAALNSEKYHYTIVKREALENELFRRRLHTAELRKMQAEMYSTALRPLNPPGTPQLTLSGHPRILQKKSEGARATKKKGGARRTAKPSTAKKPRAKKKAKTKAPKSSTPVPEDTVLAPKEEQDFVFGDHIDTVLKAHKESKAEPREPKPEPKKEAPPPPDLFDVEDISDSLVDSLLAEIHSELERKGRKTKPARPTAKKSKSAQDVLAVPPETAEKTDAPGKDTIEETSPEVTPMVQAENVDTEAERLDQPALAPDMPPETVAGPDAAEKDAIEEPSPEETPVVETESVDTEAERLEQPTPAPDAPLETTPAPAALEDKPEEAVVEHHLQAPDAGVAEPQATEPSDADKTLVTAEPT
ncbi:MAG: HAMP domain-containing protein, partial [Calditrichaeota bacterium]